MWLKITCANGHVLENEDAQSAARSKRCPTCGAVVSMWTKITCPNDHTLKVRTKHGGGTGTCPMCKEKVDIPDLELEAILHLLVPTGGGDAAESRVVKGPPPWICPKCGHPNPAKCDICPHCKPNDGLKQFFEKVKL